MSCPSAEQLARLAEGSLDAAAVAHLETCAACREVLRIAGAAVPERVPTAVGSSSFEAAPQKPTAGDSIGRYVVLRAIAQGGMGEVYLGYDPMLDRNLALKLVRADRSTPDFAARLAREAQVLAKLAHPNVVRVFDAGTWRGVGYVVMEYLDGESARTWCKTGERTAAEILRVFVGATRGIGAAHALGVVHRDIKPDNILVGKDGAGRIADFGLVSDVPRALGDPSERLTQGGLGTLGYRAPEVVAGATADARSDQWSLCAALYEMLFGELPSAERRGTRGLPAPVARALRRGLDGDPTKRFSSMDALADALEHRSRYPRYAAGIFGVATMGLVAANLMAGGPDPNAACEREAREVSAVTAPLEAPFFRGRFASFGSAAQLRHAATAREVASYKTRLASSAIGACRAERVDKAAAALERDCVADRHREVGALVTLLQAADRTGLEQAAVAIAKLPDPALCADAGRLATIVPIDPARRAEAGRVADEVASLRARWLLGERAGLLASARSVAERGERLGSTVAMSTTALVADLLSQSGELAAAREAHLAAARHAARAHDDRMLVKRLISAAGVAGVELSFERADTLLASAEILALRLGDPALQHDLDLVKAQLAYERGDGARTVELCRSLLPHLRDKASPEYFDALLQLTHGLQSIRKLDEARTVARDALAEIAARYGADHPFAVMFHTQLGAIAIDTKQYDEAKREFERALAIARTAHGLDSLVTADAMMNISGILTLQEKDGEAIEIGKQALAIAERAGSRRLANILLTLGTLYLDKGNTKEGLPYVQRSLALREEIYGASSGEVLRPLIVLGMASADAKDLDAARRYWRRAVDVLEQMPNPPDFGVELMRDLASLEKDPHTKKELIADADALERRLATRKDLAAKQK